MGAKPTQFHPSSTCPGCAERDARLAEQAGRVADLEARVAALEQMLREALRAGKRQSAPFSKGPPKSEPKKPGRKPGAGYGAKTRPGLPPRTDEVHRAALPDACPVCRGAVSPTHEARQYQAEIARRPVYRRFDIQVGRCAGCGRRVQGRHPLQTSDALGAAAARQLGPDAQAAVVHLNKQAGLSHGKVKDFFHALFGIDLSRAASCRAVLRSGRRCQGSYDAIVAAVRSSDRVVPDETGWRVGGRGAWLHAFATPDAAAYLIDPGRGAAASAKVLGEDYAGTMTHDGWAPYRAFRRATHQLCLAHLLRRCKELLDAATRGAVVFPRKVKALLKEALAARGDRDAGRLAADDLQDRMNRLIKPVKVHRANETFAKHLWANRRHLFTFLRRPETDATNWRAEQALRPAVVNRKVWGGNRTDTGAKAQSVLMSVLQTARLRGKDSIDFLSRLLRARRDDRPTLLTD
jgi:transposase